MDETIIFPKEPRLKSPNSTLSLFFVAPASFVAPCIPCPTFFVTNCCAFCLAASNLFHHIEHGDYIIKKYLFERSISVRKPSFFNK